MLLFFFILALSDDRWAIILNSSKFYFNYRHTVNALYIYQLVKNQGIPDQRIILMLPQNAPCHSRHPYPGKVVDHKDLTDYYRGDIQIDYRGKELTPEAIQDLLVGSHHPDLPRHKRLDTHSNSTIFFYMNGHGGDSYLKIQDTLVLKNSVLASALQRMNDLGRFKQMLIVLDTCQAQSMFNYVDLPGVHTVASSLTPQMARSYGQRAQLGVSTSDYFSFFFHDFFRYKSQESLQNTTLKDVLRKLPHSLIKADIAFKSKIKASEIKVMSFLSDFVEEEKRFEYQVEYQIQEGKDWGEFERTKTSSRFQTAIKKIYQ